MSDHRHTVGFICATQRAPFIVSHGGRHELTIDGAEIITFRWHPVGNSHIRDPHIHLGFTQLARDGVLSKKHHIPASRMSVEGVLRFCIDQIGVKPLRDDRAPILADSEDVFHMGATWGGDRAPQAE